LLEVNGQRRQLWRKRHMLKELFVEISR